MQSTSVVFSAFIAGSAVVMVPVIAWLWFSRRMNTSAGWVLGGVNPSSNGLGTFRSACK